MAWDSALECVVCSSKAYRRDFISANTNEKNRHTITELSKMITSYKNYLKRKMNTS